MSDEKGLSLMSEKFSLAPRNLTEAMEYAKLVASTSIVPKSYRDKEGKVNPGDVLVGIQYGMELGLHPLQALQSVAVINGNPTVWGDGMLAVIQGSGLLEEFKERNPMDALKQGAGWCKVKRKGDPDVAEITFTMEMAKTAKLTEKVGPWQQYPGRMLQMRARSWALRAKFADILKGVKCREEVEDYETIATTEEGHELQMPRRKSEAAHEVTQGAVDAFVAESPVTPSKTGGGSGNGGSAGPAQSWTGQVEKLTQQSGNKKDGKGTWTKYHIIGKDGSDFATFDKKLMERAKEFASSGELVTIGYKNTQYGNDAESVEHAAAPPEEIPADREPGAEG